MLKIWIKPASSREEALRRTGLQKINVGSRKRKLNFFGYIMRREGLANVTLTKQQSQERQRKEMKNLNIYYEEMNENNKREEAVENHNCPQPEGVCV